jgi:uncharacterized membrane protein HdeD (DUF308 family)
MGNLFKWASVAVLGLFCAFAGVGLVEDPTKNIFVAMAVLYSGAFIFIVGTIKMMKRERWDENN